MPWVVRDQDFPAIKILDETPLSSSFVWDFRYRFRHGWLGSFVQILKIPGNLADPVPWHDACSYSLDDLLIQNILVDHFP
jgi:hypothetical protein